MRSRRKKADSIKFDPFYVELMCVCTCTCTDWLSQLRNNTWFLKKTECHRINALELQCWKRYLKVPWTARRSNLSVPKEVNPEYSLEELMLKLQYFGHLMRRVKPLEMTLMLGKIEGRRRSGRQRMR